jgi:SAM-dependent methyltransferase
VGRPAFRVLPDDPEYRRQAAAEAEYWSRMVPYALESLEERFGEGPVDQYINERFTGDRRRGWQRTIARHGPFRRGLVLGLSSLRVEGEVLATNPGLHLTFMDISPGSLARRAEAFGRRFAGRVDTVCADLNFVELEPAAYDLVVSSASLHHVTNLEHLAWQIDRALAPEGWFFLNDYVGEPRFQFDEVKRRIFGIVHDRALARSGQHVESGCVWMDATDLSPFCGVRSDDILPVLRAHLREIEVRTAAALTVALMRSRPVHGRTPPPPGPGRRLLDIASRACLGLFGKQPPVAVPAPPEFLRELMAVGDVLADGEVILPGTAFATYRKRRSPGP